MPRRIAAINQFKTNIQQFIADQDYPPESHEVFKHLLNDFLDGKKGHALFAKNLLKKLNGSEAVNLMGELNDYLGENPLKQGDELESMLIAFFYYYKGLYKLYYHEDDAEKVHRYYFQNEKVYRYQHVTMQIIIPLQLYCEKTDPLFVPEETREIPPMPPLPLQPFDEVKAEFDRLKSGDKDRSAITKDMPESNEAELIMALTHFMQSKRRLAPNVALKAALLLPKLNMSASDQSLLLQTIHFIELDNKADGTTSLLCRAYGVVPVTDPEDRDFRVRTLKKYTLDDDDETRDEALKALCQLGLGNEAVLQILIDQFVQPDISEELFNFCCNALSRTAKNSG